jgi:hypothetical protein
MAQKKAVLKIFSLGHPLVTTEWRSILGDKYCHALPFDYVISDKMEDATVIAWDGVISLKQRRILPEIEAQLKKGKILLMMGESQTLFQDYQIVKIFNSPEIATIQLTGWSVLPEEILAALEACFQKIAHV